MESSTPQEKISPTEFRRLEADGLYASWSNGLRAVIPSQALREACPCAVCQEKRGDLSHSAPLSSSTLSSSTPSTSTLSTSTSPTRPKSLKIISASSSEECTLLRIWLIGNYALGAEWQDGHNTGIYTFHQLEALSQLYKKQ